MESNLEVPSNSEMVVNQDDQVGNQAVQCISRKILRKSTHFKAMPNFKDIDPLREEQEGRVREVGPQAVWSLSSCKPGFGVDQLRDKWLETYWQSDGPQPHLINIQFRKKTTIQDIYLYADYKLDESYTPNRVSVRAGTHFHDLQEIDVIELNEPSGWVKMPLKDSYGQPIRTYLVQIAVLSNHQNGRDTHLRQIRVHSPVERHCFAAIKFPVLTSVECSSYSCIR